LSRSPPCCWRAQREPWTGSGRRDVQRHWRYARQCSAAIVSTIKTIVGPGGDCELYQPTAADGATVASARAVFINDLNEEFEPWLEPLLKQALFKGTKVVVTAVCGP